MCGIELNRHGELQLWRQIYQSLRDQIVGAQWKAGEPLPSTRELARGLHVSRNTVSLAYEMLAAEGFVLCSQGAPTRVAHGLQLEPPRVEIPEQKRETARIYAADFHTGRPDLRLFPRYLWQQTLHKVSDRLPLEQLGYTGPDGLAELRGEITAWLYRSRGISVSAEDIFITAGATHALHIIAELLDVTGRGILMEDPCHIGMLRTFQRKGCTIVAVPADELGIQTEYLKHEENICAVYVTPSHQFPLGGVLPAFRRAELIRFVREHDMYIIEDDYDSEFRYSGEPVAPLFSLEPHRVVYVGTFSKSLFPALRIGYVILPRPLQTQWRMLRTHTDVQNPPFEQAALAELLRTRKLDRHVQKMRRIYAQRRQTLLSIMDQEFGRCFRTFGDAAGLHLTAEFPGMVFDTLFQSRCQKNGIYVMPVEHHCIEKGKRLDQLVIGYGHLNTEEIKQGIKLLHNVIPCSQATTDR